MAETILEGVNLTKTYKRGTETIIALRDVSLKIGQGDFICIAGPSGSGKTTLLNLLGGLDRPVSGEVYLDGNNISQLPENTLAKIRRENIGFVFQNSCLISTLTAKENVQLPLLFSKSPRDAKRLAEILKKVGLDHRKDHLPSQLSGGEMQRVSVARALINSPRILLADEPTGNLDSKSSQRIFDLLKSLSDSGLSIVAATHDVKLFGLRARLVELENGKIGQCR